MSSQRRARLDRTARLSNIMWNRSLRATAAVPLDGPRDRPRFAIFVEPGAATGDLLVGFAGLAEPLVRPRIHNNGIWLVRPDGYVACSSGDVKVVGDYLASLVRPVRSTPPNRRGGVFSLEAREMDDFVHVVQRAAPIKEPCGIAVTRQI
jgi:hypothetical protein